MNGDAHAPGTGTSQPLPPAFTETPPRRLESPAEQALHRPFFPGASPTPAEPAWAEQPEYEAAAAQEPADFAAPAEFGGAVASEEPLPTAEDFGYLEETAEETTTGEIPPDAFLETAPLPGNEAAFEPPPLPTYDEPVYAEPALPTYDEPPYAEPAYAEPQAAYGEPVYAEPVQPAYDEPAFAAAPAAPAPEAPAPAEAEVADRLEALARELRSRGRAAVDAGFAGDALDAALAGLISGYLAGRGR